MKYFCIKQMDETDCAAACLSTICKQHGVNKNITKIRELAGTDKNGTNGIGVIKAATELGYNAYGVEIENKKLLDNEILYPCIAHVNIDGMNHYVVIHRAEGEHIIIADPAEGIVDYNYDDFMSIWTGILFILEPTEQLTEIENDKSVLSGLIDIAKIHKGMALKIILISFCYTFVGIVCTLFFNLYLISLFQHKISMCFICSELVLFC